MSDPLAAAAETGRRERKRLQTANHLAATAFRLFEAHGYEAVAMEQIAVEADVAKGTLYKYFPVKEALLAHQFRLEITGGMAPLQGAMDRQPNFAARMKFLLRASVQWNESRRAYLPYYLRFRMMHASYGDGGSLPEEYRSGSYEILEALFRVAQDAGEIRSDVEPGRAALMFEFMLLGAVMGWLNRPGSDLNTHFQFALDLCLRGVAVPPGKTKSKR